MPFASKNVARKWFFVTIFLVTAANVLASGEKRLDLTIGFDLTQGANGVPSLRIRDFEESSELNPRAKEGIEGSGEKKATMDTANGKVRADSFSDSEENIKSAAAPKSVSKESKSNNEDDDDDDNSSEGNKKISTRGLSAADFEPEENPKVHRQYRETEEDSDKNHRRKRHVNFRSKGKWRRFI